MTAGSIVMLLVGWNLYRGPRADVALTYGFYFDLQSGQLFVASLDQRPPIAAPSGHAQGVFAVVLSCDDCEDRERRFTAWIEQRIEGKPPLAGEAAVLGTGGAVSQIAAPPMPGIPPKWFNADSAQARAVQQAATQRCGSVGQSLAACRPESSDLRSLELLE